MYEHLHESDDTVLDCAVCGSPIGDAAFVNTGTLCRVCRTRHRRMLMIAHERLDEAHAGDDVAREVDHDVE